MADEEKADAPADDAAAKEDDGANAEEKADATDGGGDAASGEAEPAKAGSAAASGKPGPADFGLILTILGSFVGLYNSLTTYSYVPDDDIVLEMGKPGLVCVGAMESPFILTKLCAAMWALAQLYIAFPIMLGGEDAFNLLGLFNAFCISALPLLTGPLVKVQARSALKHMHLLACLTARLLGCDCGTRASPLTSHSICVRSTFFGAVPRRAERPDLRGRRVHTGSRDRRYDRREPCVEGGAAGDGGDHAY